MLKDLREILFIADKLRMLEHDAQPGLSTWMGFVSQCCQELMDILWRAGVRPSSKVYVPEQKDEEEKKP
jgi:hypothetical protein